MTPEQMIAIRTAFYDEMEMKWTLTEEEIKTQLIKAGYTSFVPSKTMEYERVLRKYFYERQNTQEWLKLLQPPCPIPGCEGMQIDKHPGVWPAWRCSRGGSLHHSAWVLADKFQRTEPDTPMDKLILKALAKLEELNEEKSKTTETA